MEIDAGEELESEIETSFENKELENKELKDEELKDEEINLSTEELDEKLDEKSDEITVSDSSNQKPI